MPRVIKHPDQRRAELLDHSLRLFLQRGFSNTSLNDVIAASAVSKGAFYHYFSSKDALLDALASRFADERLRQLNLPPRKPNETALKRLNLVLANLRELRLENIGVPDFAVAGLFRPENRALYQRISLAWERVFRPVFAQIFIDGVEEGTFQTEDPEGVADLLLVMIAQGRSFVERALNGKGTGNREDAFLLIDRNSKLHGIAIDRLLGLPDGSTLTAHPGFGKALLAKLQGSKVRPKSRKAR